MALKKTILVVDDEKDIVDDIQEYLTSEDRKVMVAHNPSDAYSKAANQKFDVIISDFRMQKTNGIELIKGIRLQKKNATTPVIMISGFHEEAMDAMVDLPDVYVLGKPFSLDDLVKIVEDTMSIDRHLETKKDSLKKAS